MKHPLYGVGQRVTRKTLGDEWPLMVDELTLYNRSGAVVAEIGGVFYAVNGWAKGGLGLTPLEDTWESGDHSPRKNLGPLIRLGLSMGDEK